MKSHRLIPILALGAALSVADPSHSRDLALPGAPADAGDKGAAGKTGADPLSGDFKGTLDGKKVAAQCLALGGGKYQLNLLSKFDARDAEIGKLNGETDGGKTVFKGKAGDVEIEAAASGAAIRGGGLDLEKIERLSPTLGAKPPAGAKVLFDGSGTEAWQKQGGGDAPWKVIDGAMQVGGGSIVSKEEFGDCTIHVEFQTPFMPEARGQGRGNSGVYLMGRYECQVLDSYGLSGEHNECGGVYTVAKPLVNMCAPPLQWQTYDIEFTAPRFEGGKKVANAKMTVTHNGVKIHDGTEIPKPTTAAMSGQDAEKGPLYLQDHGNPVRYRNIWVQPR